MRCPTVRTRLMSLMCSCWHGMFIFASDWLKVQVIYCCSGSLGSSVMWVSYFDLSSPHLCHHVSSVYHLVEWIVLHMKYCISVTTWRYFHSSAAGSSWLTDWELLWHLRFEMRDLCSQHIPFFPFMTIQHFYLLEKHSFCYKSWRHFPTLWYIYTKRYILKCLIEAHFCLHGSELYFLSL